MIRVEKSAGIIAGVAALYQLFMASRVLTWFGIFVPAPQHRAVSLSLGLFLIYALRSPRGSSRKGSLAWYDVLILAGGLLGAGFVVFDYSAYLDYSVYGYLDVKGILLVLLLAISLFEASRRLTGWALPLIVLFFMLMTTFQNHLPGLLFGKGFGPDRLGYNIYVGTGGIFGISLGVATTILITYIVFGTLMTQAGAGQFFINLALVLTGKMRGGVAKGTVFASCLFGMISGSPSAEVATVGSISIPMMISTGYSPKFAAAVEAVAGTGGLFMPPVMGAIVFIMADWIGVPYAKIAMSAFVPAVLYYLVLFVSIHFEAVKIGLKPIPRSEIPTLSKTFREGWLYLIPIIVLIYLLIGRSFPPEMAGIYAILALIGISYLLPDKGKRLTLSKIWAAMVGGANTWIILAGVTATVGMLIGALSLSGLGIKFSGFILDLTHGNLLMTLILVGIAAFILGMGLDAIPAYITLVILAGPALINLGIPPMTAHFYVIYWGLSGFITPPVCVAVYVACGISGSKIWGTGWQAVRLGIAVFIIPFAFIYNPALLAQGQPAEIIAAVITAALGGILVAAGVSGYFWISSITWWQRSVMFFGGLFLIGPTTLWTTVIGVGLGLLGVLGTKSFGLGRISKLLSTFKGD